MHILIHADCTKVDAAACFTICHTPASWRGTESSVIVLQEVKPALSLSDCYDLDRILTAEFESRIKFTLILEDPTRIAWCTENVERGQGAALCARLTLEREQLPL